MREEDTGRCEMNTLYERIQQALAQKLMNLKPQVAFRKDYPCHLVECKDNLLDGITDATWQKVSAEIDDGLGGELKPRRRRRGTITKILPPKFAAVQSSSALVEDKIPPIDPSRGFPSREEERAVEYENLIRAGHPWPLRARY